MADRRLFEAEALVWAESLYRAALALCLQPSLADDLVQSTYLRAWERFETFGSGSNAKAWLLTILRNLWIDHLRQVHRVVWQGPAALDYLAAPAQAGPVVEALQVSAAPPDSDAMDKLLETIGDERLAAALTKLSPDSRLALFLVDVEGYTHQEAAAVLGIPAGTVKSRTSRARHAIHAQLTGSDRELIPREDES